MHHLCGGEVPTSPPRRSRDQSRESKNLTIKWTFPPEDLMHFRPESSFADQRHSTSFRQGTGRLRVTYNLSDPIFEPIRGQIPPGTIANYWPRGARVWMWKQDPSVTHIGIRKVFLPSDIFKGPRDDRIASVGRLIVGPDQMGDFLLGFENPRDFENLTSEGIEAMDMVHCFAVVRQALTMYQRALARRGRPAELPWRWNIERNKNPIKVTTDIILQRP